MLFGSMPSAIQATLTPAPVMPSDRAVGWLGSSESVLVSDSPSGIELRLAVRLQAPGITFGVSDVAWCDFGLWRISPVGTCAPAPRLNVDVRDDLGHGGFGRSRAASPLDTVAANALTSEKLLMWVACTWRSSLDHRRLGGLDRVGALRRGTAARRGQPRAGSS